MSSNNTSSELRILRWLAGIIGVSMCIGLGIPLMLFVSVVWAIPLGDGSDQWAPLMILVLAIPIGLPLLCLRSLIELNIGFQSYCYRHRSRRYAHPALSMQALIQQSELHANNAMAHPLRPMSKSTQRRSLAQNIGICKLQGRSRRNEPRGFNAVTPPHGRPSSTAYLW